MNVCDCKNMVVFQAYSGCIDDNNYYKIKPITIEIVPSNENKEVYLNLRCKKVKTQALNIHLTVIKRDRGSSLSNSLTCFFFCLIGELSTQLRIHSL